VTVVLELGEGLRSELKEPFGPVDPDTAAVLRTAGRPLVTVGDIVTFHVLDADTTPDVALVDERTQRAAVDEHVREAIDDSRFDRELTVGNPPGTLTIALLEALRAALADDATTLIRVDGEEDLAALPVIATAPDGASVLYGQPDEGVVHVSVDDAVRARVRDMLTRMDGDGERAFDILGVDDA